MANILSDRIIGFSFDSTSQPFGWSRAITSLWRSDITHDIVVGIADTGQPVFDEL